MHIVCMHLIATTLSNVCLYIINDNASPHLVYIHIYVQCGRAAFQLVRCTLSTAALSCSIFIFNMSTVVINLFHLFFMAIFKMLTIDSTQSIDLFDGYIHCMCTLNVICHDEISISTWPNMIRHQIHVTHTHERMRARSRTHMLNCRHDTLVLFE